MDRRARIAGGSLVVAGLGALVLSPAIFALVGWRGGDDAARFDPLLSLCLASRPGTGPGQLGGAWSFAPQTVLPWLLLIVLYGWGAAAGRERHRLGAARIGAFAGAAMLLAAALFSPLCRLAATLASAHMIQHILIVTIIPPLLLWGRPRATIARIPWLRRRLGPGGEGGGEGAGRLLDRPVLACILYGAVIWLSHAPAIYQAALRDPNLHLLLLTVQLGAGLLFWRIVVRCMESVGGGRGGQAGAALLMLFVTFMHTGLLSALLTFAGAPLYPIYELRAQAWGLTPLADQQLAGLIMWVPMSVIFLTAASVVMIQLLSLEEPRPS